MVEGEAVIDDVVGPHAEAVVHQGSHPVIPGKAELRAPWALGKAGEEPQAPPPQVFPAFCSTGGERSHRVLGRVSLAKFTRSRF